VDFGEFGVDEDEDVVEGEAGFRNAYVWEASNLMCIYIIIAWAGRR
jgi:hypothetical protein